MSRGCDSEEVSWECGVGDCGGEETRGDYVFEGSYVMSHVHEVKEQEGRKRPRKFYISFRI